MRRLLSIFLAVAAAGVLVAFGSAEGGTEGNYEVRAIFDNGGFLVAGEEVRIAGAKVGQITEVDVTGTDEPAREDGSPAPGKAVVVMRIDDPGFQDFRQDASCFIRPQSLLGEKFVECQVTEPRAAGSTPPPELEEVPEGEPGAGQRLLPLEANGKAVDIDLVNDIMREPYPDRFRLILNDLGAGLATRGDDLEEILKRANPALERTDKVLAILARQNKQLAQLARDGDQALGPLAQEREHLGNFVNQASVAAAATAERRADLEAGFQKLPGFLRELRATMTALDDFSTSSTPVISDLGDAAPDLTRINQALEPVADNGTVALKSLGEAAKTAGPDLVASQPVLGDLEKLANSSKPVGALLNKLLSSLRTTGGLNGLMKTIYNLGGAFNSFDSLGHFLRLLLPLNNCVDYDIVPTGGGGLSCEANFNRPQSKAPAKPKDPSKQIDPRELQRALDEIENDGSEANQEDLLDSIPIPPIIGGGDDDGEEEPPPVEPPADEGSAAEPQSASAKTNRRMAGLLMDYLMGPGPEQGAKR